MISETAGDVRDTMINGESGLLAIFPPDRRPEYEPSKRNVRFHGYPDVNATVFTAENYDQLRGPQHDTIWIGELAKVKLNKQQQVLDNAEFGLRLGDDPCGVIETTPQPTPTIKGLIKNPDVALATGRMDTFVNRDNLADSFFNYVYRRYHGTRLGRQELYAEIIDDVPGALWTWETIQRQKIAAVPIGVQPVEMGVAIDPATSVPARGVAESATQDDERRGKIGITVGMRGSDNNCYLFDDLSMRGMPEEWARVAVGAYRTRMASWIVGEGNNGGAMIEAVLRAVDPTVNYQMVWASRAKITRAEPVAALYAQGRVFHVVGDRTEKFEALEEQMRTWVPGMPSPDEMDSWVWAVTKLMRLDGSGSPWVRPVAAGASPIPREIVGPQEYLDRTWDFIGRAGW